MRVTIEYQAFTVYQHIHTAVQTILIAVDPFNIFQFGILVELKGEAAATSVHGTPGHALSAGRGGIEPGKTRRQN